MRNRRSTARAAVTGVLAATLIAACSNPTPEPTSTTTLVTPTPTPTPTASPTPSADPRIAAAEAAILEVYRGYWELKVAIYADPSQDRLADLGAYSLGNAWTDVATTVVSLRDSGIAVLGEPVLDPEVAEIVVDQSATITDCVDSTDWRPVYVATGESAAVGGQAPRLINSTKVVFDDGRWVVSESVFDRETVC